LSNPSGPEVKPAKKRQARGHCIHQLHVHAAMDF
jgi:hypothetical protein